VSVRDQASNGPLNLPQPYWMTFVHDYPAGREHLWLRLSYGSNSDEKLLGRLK